MKTKMIYDLIKQVKETGVGADGTVVCSMDELVALVDYAEELAYDDGYDNGRADGYDAGYDEAYCEDYEDYEDGYRLGYASGYREGCEDGYKDNKSTLEEFFKELTLMQMAKSR